MLWERLSLIVNEFEVNSAFVTVVQKKASSNDEAFLKMAPPAGLEPATYGLTVRRSTN